MRKWLKYTLIGLIMFIGVNKVSAAATTTCYYETDAVASIHFTLTYFCTASVGGELTCDYYTKGQGINNKLKMGDSNLKLEDFISDGKVVCPSIIYADKEYTQEFNILIPYIPISYYKFKNFSVTEFETGFGHQLVEFVNNQDLTSVEEIRGDNSNKTDGSDKDYVDGCEDLGETGKLIKQIYNFLKYLIPILVIGLSIVDFLKVVLNGEEKVFKEAWTKFVKRIIVGVVIIILPAILSLIINLSGVLGDYGIDENNIFCIFK